MLINDQNRLSLGRCQVVAWSVLVLPAIFAYAAFNAGLLFESAPGMSLTDTLPTVPGQIWSALGISFGSTMISSALVSAKGAGVSPIGVLGSTSRSQGSGVSMYRDPNSLLDSNASGSDAAMADLFLGEDAGDANQIDISRVQMVAITVGLISTYATAIFAQVSRIGLPALAQAASDASNLLPALPDAGTTFVGLMLLSHSAYLVSKASPAANSGPGVT